MLIAAALSSYSHSITLTGSISAVRELAIEEYEHEHDILTSLSCHVIYHSIYFI